LKLPNNFATSGQIAERKERKPNQTYHSEAHIIDDSSSVRKTEGTFAKEKERDKNLFSSLKA
jgi:hypothetical protein